MKTNSAVGKLTLRKDDQVQVIAGREKGKIGKVLHIDRDSARITIEKINLVKRHVKPTQQAPQGGILEKELPLHYSNVLLYCPKCTRGTRHGVKLAEKVAAKKGGAKKQVKIRYCKKCSETVDAA